MVHPSTSEAYRGVPSMPDDKGSLIEELTASIPGVVYQMVVRPDDSWHFEFVSKGIEDLFGISQADACRDAAMMTDCIVVKDRLAHRESIRMATGTLHPKYFDYRIKTMDSRLKWIRSRSLPKKQPDGSIVWSGILTDITEQKNLEASYRKAQESATLAEAVISSQQQLRTLIEAMPDAVFFKDGQGFWLITNKVAVDLFGLQDIPWEGKSDRELMALCPEHAKTFEICIHSDESVWNSGKTFHTEELVFSHDQPRRILHMTKVPLYNPDGSRKGLVAIGRDITAQKQMEETLWNNSLHTVEMIEKERASIARDLHDDLSQTMTALSFEVKKVHNLVSSTNPAVTECIDTLFEYIDSMTASIHRIRTTLKPLLLDELGLEAALELLAEELSIKSGLQIHVDCSCVINCTAEDSTHVFRIVNEALSNCVKHSQATHVTVTCARSLDECLLEISDNGIGFMYPAVSTVKSFGLVGMKERADILGARLDIRSAVHKGTVVRLYMPCRREKGGIECDFS